MKVILLSGSPKASGNTRQALDECAKVLEEAGVEAEVISLHGTSIAACKACYACKKTGRCAIEDDLNALALKVKEADGFIVGSPVYFGTARGDVMNFLQRLGMVSGTNGGFLAGKIGGPIVVGRRGGHTSTLQEMLMFFFITGMTVPGSTYWNILFGKQPGEVMEDSEGLGVIRTFAANVAELIQKTR